MQPQVMSQWLKSLELYSTWSWVVSTRAALDLFNRSVRDKFARRSAHFSVLFCEYASFLNPMEAQCSRSFVRCRPDVVYGRVFQL
jgi:hypothetical protein